MARSRTSTTEKPKRGNAGIEPSKSFLTASTEAENGPKNRFKNQAGIDGGEFKPTTIGRKPCPRRALGYCLRPIVRGCAVAVRLVSPILLCEGSFANWPTVDDRRESTRS
jgi:hypothetical protein